MKILVLSLLRLGDIILATPALRGLRERHPEAKIHLMINAQFKQIAPLMPYIDQVILFDRDRLQKGLGDASVPMFDSYERLQDFVDEVDSQGYDTIVNLTHSRLSGWLMSVIAAKDRIGLTFDGQGRATFGTNWFRYLNSQADSEGPEVFHFSDVFKFALNVADHEPRRDRLVETSQGRAEAAAFALDANEELIAVQALTSDAKKDWGFANYIEAMRQIQVARPRARFALLGAPFEQPKLEELAVKAAAAGVRAELAILSFEGAFSFLKRTRLLLTGDTSVKHLACAAGTPVVEISIGSSDLHRTGSYLHGSLIVQSRETCAPCVHSRPCHRDFHACAKRIPAEVVAVTVVKALDKQVFQLRTIAEEYKEDVEILRVDLRTAGFWAAPSVIEPFTEASVGRWIDRACRKLWLDPGARASRMGTEILQLSAFLTSLHPQVSAPEWSAVLADFEKQLSAIEGRVNGFKVGLQYLRGGYEDPRRMKEFVRTLISFRDRIRNSALLSSFKDSLDRAIEDDISPAFTRFRHITDLVSEIEVRSAIYLKLVRGLAKSGEREKGIEKI